MRGSGKCPLRTDHICIKNGFCGIGTEGYTETPPCEWWDEYEQECAINLLVRYLRKFEGARSE